MMAFSDTISADAASRYTETLTFTAGKPWGENTKYYGTIKARTR